jgi:hypothetical protein
MWIDLRSGDIKVYETQPVDPFIMKMTWVPQENAWVLFQTPPTLQPLHFAQMLNDPVQTQAMKEFNAGKLSYAEMRGLCG